MKNDELNKTNRVEAKKSSKQPYQESKRKSPMDWGVLDLAESVQARKSPEE